MLRGFGVEGLVCVGRLFWLLLVFVVGLIKRKLVDEVLNPLKMQNCIHQSMAPFPF